jgi:acetyl esterase/lipase
MKVPVISRSRPRLRKLSGGGLPLQLTVSEESDQIARAIRARGGVVEYKFYEEEGHSFSRLENSIDSFERTVAFLTKHMR